MVSIKLAHSYHPFSRALAFYTEISLLEHCCVDDGLQAASPCLCFLFPAELQTSPTLNPIA